MPLSSDAWILLHQILCILNCLAYIFPILINRLIFLLFLYLRVWNQRWRKCQTLRSNFAILQFIAIIVLTHNNIIKKINEFQFFWSIVKVGKRWPIGFSLGTKKYFYTNSAMNNKDNNRAWWQCKVRDHCSKSSDGRAWHVCSIRHHTSSVSLTERCDVTSLKKAKVDAKCHTGTSLTRFVGK